MIGFGRDSYSDFMGAILRYFDLNFNKSGFDFSNYTSLCVFQGHSRPHSC